ncbi:PDZ domain-containing protein [Gulosibacter chungangensis]|uniref:PDZ domain-containing protein n=2 Tax=Gulosibacter chungangensis TaxID=979746 RepID=A0A7J5BDH7_9MICO|nr:PDZ domain-containing protein [Gulosibacter chungangensis]
MPPLPPLDPQYGVPQTPYGQVGQQQTVYGQPAPRHDNGGYGEPPQFGQQHSPLAGPQPYFAGSGSTRAKKPRRAPGWTPIIVTAAVVGLIAGGASAYAINLSQPYIAGSSPAVVQVEGADIDWTAVAEAVSNSVVSIQVSSSAGTGQGSGVVWDDQGHVVTNHHVVETAADGGQIVVMVGNHAYPATLVGSDAATDLAVIQLEEIPAGLAALARGDSTSLEVGAEVMAVGSPLGLSGSVTTGIVSALDRPVSTGQIENSLIVTNAIQTSAPLNPGNSGGALVDAAGQLIGINSSIATLGSSESTSGSIGIGFAIPVQLAENIASQLIDTGKVEHAYLGTSTTTGQADLSDGSAVVGADVKDVVEDGPAEAAGIEVGDLIVAINDKQITSSEHLVGTVRALKVGETASFTVIRNGKEQTVEVTMGVSPDLGG